MRPGRTPFRSLPWPARLLIGAAGLAGCFVLLERLGAALNTMAERLARQERIRRDFLANASHEFRTPLSNIRVALETLLEAPVAPVEQQRRMLRGAVGEIERLTLLVGDLLDLARIESEARAERAEAGGDRRELSCLSLVQPLIAAVTPRLEATPGHLHAEVLHHRVRFHGGPHIALGRLHTPVPRRPDHQLDALRTRGRQQVVDISFPVTNADKARLGTPVLRLAHRRQTGEPFLAFFLADRQLLAPGALAHVGGVTGPHLLGQQPQGKTLGRERQRSVHV